MLLGAGICRLNPKISHCKQLEPVYTALAEELKSIPNIVIAKMDGTENDLPLDSPYQVQGFPTLFLLNSSLKLYKAETNEVVDFDESRDLEGLKKFLKAKAVHGSEIKEDSAQKESVSDDRDEL